MPRIDAPSVAEHVARQEVLVVDTAARLFAARGYANVTLADIAAEMGLARTSIYRYFPDKAAIVKAWLAASIGPLVAAGEAAMRPGHGTPARARLLAWVDVQLQFLTDARHAVMIRAAMEADELPPAMRADLQDLHLQLYTPLQRLLVEVEPALRAPAARLRAQLIAGLIRTAADAIRAGARPRPVTAELHRSVALVGTGATA